MEVLLLLLSALCLLHLTTASHRVVALEAQVGSTVVMPCPSNDDDHRFQFWQLVGDEVIGPGNAIDKTKYKYEVLTGKLYINGISTAEAGFYKCVSKELTGDGMHIQSVELIVRKEWEEEYETDHSTNIYRVLVAVGVLLCLMVVGVLLYIFYTSQKVINRITRLDEESLDDGPPVRGTYNPTTVPSTSTSNFMPQDIHGVDSPMVDTDFPTAFKTL